jgi:hypothetical protein
MAEYIRDTVYRIISEPPNADEVWAFKTGDIVRCRKMGFASGKTELVAFEIFGGLNYFRVYPCPSVVDYFFVRTFTRNAPGTGFSETTIK